ncbi:MAG: helix-turn-helix domain-containing protein [Gammaproteobacteria bacterium]|nr:helix-turn-helix domain-containing protein [Gammaproteobacteria bacterium]
MIDRQIVFEIHRLKNEGCSNRKIAGIMGINRQTVSKYIRNPDSAVLKTVKRSNELEPYYELIDQFLEIGL